MGDIIGGVIGAFGQQKAAEKQADAARYAADKALTGYNYLTEGAGAQAIQPYIESGTAANQARSALLGIGGGGGGGGGSAGGSEGYTQGNFPYRAYIDSHDGIGQGNSRYGKPDRARAWQDFQSNGGTWTDPSNPPPTAEPAVDPTEAANAAFDNYLNSTGYQFQFGQGMDAINSNAATAGLLDSGGTLKALNKFGQGVASQSFNNYLNQLGGVAEAGRGAVGQIASAGAAGGGGAANAILQGGNASAAGTVAGYNALGNAVGQGFNALSNRVGQKSQMSLARTTPGLY